MNQKAKRSTVEWIWDFAGKFRPKYVLSVLSAVCSVICGILPYFVMASIIENLLCGCRDTDIYLKSCLLMAVLWMGRCGFHSISTTLSHKAKAILDRIPPEIIQAYTQKKTERGRLIDITQWNNDEWNGFADLLANLIEKYAAVLDIDNLPEPPVYVEAKNNKVYETKKNFTDSCIDDKKSACYN